jgi:hypothetical protein
MSQEILRVLRELRKGWYVLQFPDRAVLIGQILPALSKPGATILWVGCQAYTRRYPVIIERQGAECWTLEIDPAEQRWGHPKRHTVGDLRNDNLPSDYLHPATPTSLCTDIEPYMAPYKWMTINGWSGFVKKQLTSQTAIYLLQSQALIRKSLPLRLIATNPVLIDDNGEPRLLSKGYHPEVGGMLVEREDVP